MANALPKPSQLNREEFVRILDLPSREFRAAKAAMSDAELAEMRRIWQEESVEAIADYNRYVNEHGLPLAKYRMF